MSDVTVRRIKKVNHVDGCRKLRTCWCPFEYEAGWQYDIRFTWPSGKAFREKKKVPLSGLTEKKALGWATERRNVIIARGEPGPETDKPEVKVPTLAAFKDAYLRHKRGQRLKASTDYARESILRKHIIPVLGEWRLDEIDTTAVDELKERMEEHADKTVNNVLAILSNMVRVAKDLKVIREMPIEKFGLFRVDTSKPPPYYTEEELGRLVAAALKLGRNVAAAVLLGGDAGLRCGEILAFPPFGVKWQLRSIHVDRQVWRTVVDSPKGGKTRDVPMTDRLEWVLKSLGHVKGERLLLRDDRQPYNVKQLRALIAQAQFEAGLESTGNVHILRHTFCTRLAMKGVPPVTIQKLAGHAHLGTTMRYMHVVKGAEAAAIAELNAPLPRAEVGDPVPVPDRTVGDFGRILVDSTEATKTSVLSTV